MGDNYSNQKLISGATSDNLVHFLTIDPDTD